MINIVSEDPSVPTTPMENGDNSEGSDANNSPTADMCEELEACLEQFVEDWVLSRDHENTISLSLFLSFHFMHLLKFMSTKAAEYTAIMIGKSDRTVTTVESRLPC